MIKKKVITHDTSHTGIGKALRFQAPGFRTAWFSEGFNDYFSICVLANTGMLDKASFLDHLNEDNLKGHYTNPANTAPADSIEKYFWKSHNYESLSYERGFTYAFYLDNQIRQNCNCSKTFRDF